MLTMTIAAKLQKEIEKVASIYGVSIGKIGKPETVRIDFTDDATEEQKNKAKKIVENFKWIITDEL